jgi:hypothetical protein
MLFNIQFLFDSTILLTNSAMNYDWSMFTSVRLTLDAVKGLCKDFLNWQDQPKNRKIPLKNYSICDPVPFSTGKAV